MSSCKWTPIEIQANQCNKGLLFFVIFFVFLYMKNLTV